jgi:hypothetical protein
MKLSSQRWLLHIGLVAVLFFSGCNGGKMREERISLKALDDVPDDAWTELSEKKVFFGHQSVGFNIIKGIQDVMKEKEQIKLNIVETTDPLAFDEPTLAHARVGRNTDPKSKIDAFTELMESGIGDKADIAFFKLCYVDIAANTDVEDLFEAFTMAMTRLETKFPDTIFIPVTVPLAETRTSIKTWLKKVMGKKHIWEYDANVRRNHFNERLREHCEAKGPLFDLGRLESTLPDGRRATFTIEGRTYESLAPDYTDDGGHLNAVGRRRAAEELLVLLASLAK